MTKKFTVEEAYFAAVRTDLKMFMLHSFTYLYPNKEFMDNWHIDAILHCLEQSIEGKLPRLIINLPPRQLKSFMVSIVLPAFILGMDPSARIIGISYSKELSMALSRDFRRIIESEWYQRLFPEVKPAKLTEDEFVTTAGGYRLATSVGGSLTGKGADFILLDDPIKPEDAQSEKLRESTNNWYRSTVLSRLDDKEKSVLILVMQRLHAHDLTALMEDCGGFHKLSLPAVAIINEQIPTGHDQFYARKAGEALHEARENLQILNSLKNQITPYHFAAQYQQHPEAPEGGMFRREWFKLTTTPPAIEYTDHFYVSIDTAFSTAETADYSVITLIYVNKEGLWILGVERGHWDYELLKHKVQDYIHRYGRNINFVVECAGIGISLISALKKGNLRCYHYSPTDSKTVRAAYALPIFHAGMVHILNVAGKNDWVEPYINEFMAFPHGRHDDQVDSLVQLILWLGPRHYSPPKLVG